MREEEELGVSNGRCDGVRAASQVAARVHEGLRQ